MIEELRITNPAGSILTLDMRTSQADHDILIYNIEGLGSPKATVSGLGGPNLAGSVINAIKIDYRQITLTLAITAHGSEAAGNPEELARKKIYEYFPVGKEIDFRVIATDKDVTIKAYVEQNEVNHFAKVENAVISLYCAKPYWDNFAQQTPAISAGGTTVTKGEVDQGVDIFVDFTGSVTGDLTITNTNGSQSMTFDFTEITQKVSGGQPTQNGDRLIINTRVGQKSVVYTRSSTGYNLFSGIGINDDWLKLLAAGTNTIGWSVGGGSSNMDLELNYYPQQEGV
jgi:hypothetical protein